MKRSAFALIVVAALVLAACGKNTSNIKPPHELSAITPTLNVQRLWTAHVGRGADGVGVRMRPAYEDNVVYVASANGYLKAIDAANGDTLWEKTRPWRPRHDVAYAGGPVVKDGILVIGTVDGTVYTYEAKTGKLLWQASLSSSNLSRPVITDDLIVVRTANGNITALHRADGSKAWVYDRNVVPTLSLRGDGGILVAHGVCFAGTDDGKVAALRLDNGEPLWEHPLSQSEGRTEIERLNDADGQLLLSGNTLYTANVHGQVTALDARGGQILWSHPFSSYVGMALEGTTLVGIDDASNVWAWDTASGNNLWKQDGLEWRWLGTPATQDGYAVIGDLKGYVHWLDLSDGSFAARARISHDAIRSRPLVLADGRVVVLDSKGNISAWKVDKI